MLARPADRRVEQAGDADPVWQPTFDGGLDEARRQEGQRDRHMDVALLQASCAAMPSIVAVPALMSDSHCRPRAMAVTSLTLVPERIGRTCVREGPSEAMTSRKRR